MHVYCVHYLQTYNNTTKQFYVVARSLKAAMLEAEMYMKKTFISGCPIVNVDRGVEVMRVQK